MGHIVTVGTLGLFVTFMGVFRIALCLTSPLQICSPKVPLDAILRFTEVDKPLHHDKLLTHEGLIFIKL